MTRTTTRFDADVILLNKCKKLLREGDFYVYTYCVLALAVFIVFKRETDVFAISAISAHVAKIDTIVNNSWKSPMKGSEVQSVFMKTRALSKSGLMLHPLTVLAHLTCQRSLSMYAQTFVGCLHIWKVIIWDSGPYFSVQSCTCWAHKLCLWSSAALIYICAAVQHAKGLAAKIASHLFFMSIQTPLLTFFQVWFCHYSPHVLYHWRHIYIEYYRCKTKQRALYCLASERLPPVCFHAIFRIEV